MEGEERNSKRHSIGLPMNIPMSRMSRSSELFEKPYTVAQTSHTVDGRKTFLSRHDFPVASAHSGRIFPGVGRGEKMTSPARLLVDVRVSCCS